MISDVLTAIKNLGATVFGCTGYMFGDTSGNEEVFVVSASGYSASRTCLSGAQYTPNLSLECYHRFHLNRNVDNTMLDKILKAVEFCNKCVYIPGVSQCNYTGLSLDGNADICTINFQVTAMGDIPEY